MVLQDMGYHAAFELGVFHFWDMNSYQQCVMSKFTLFVLLAIICSVSLFEVWCKSQLKH